MNISLPSDTVFRRILNTIKQYRKSAQQNISTKIKNIAVDRSMVLLCLAKFPALTQNEPAELVFKDNAFMTRMIEVMVRNQYLKRSINEQDRRRFNIEITAKGNEVLNLLPRIISENRTTSLAGITKKELSQLETILDKIKPNCI